MISYWAGLIGLGLNFLATILLLRYSPESKAVEGTTVTHDFEKEFVPEFRNFLKTARYSILLLLLGFGFQFFAALLLKSDCVP
jgi:hypothetical protein